MKSERIKKVFEQTLPKTDAAAFHFVPQEADKKMKGLLLSNGVSLSLSFEDGTDLAMNQLPAFRTVKTAPDRRIIRFERPLENSLIKGIVSVSDLISEASIKASVYFIIEQNEA